MSDRCFGRVRSSAYSFTFENVSQNTSAGYVFIHVVFMTRAFDAAEKEVRRGIKRRVDDDDDGCARTGRERKRERV